MTPKFSTITDLYSVSQLQKALVEARDIAHAFLACAIEHTEPTGEMFAAFSSLQEAATVSGLEIAGRQAKEARHG